jgi:putative flippase GtrA
MRYLLTGGTAAIVDIGGFGLLSSVRIPTILAAASSFCVASVVNYLLTSRLVFRATATSQGFVMFLMGACLCLPVNVAVTSLGMSYLGLPRAVAKTIAIGATFLLNFWINTRFVFDRESADCRSISARNSKISSYDPLIWVVLCCTGIGTFATAARLPII